MKWFQWDTLPSNCCVYYSCVLLPKVLGNSQLVLYPQFPPNSWLAHILIFKGKSLLKVAARFDMIKTCPKITARTTDFPAARLDFSHFHWTFHCERKLQALVPLLKARSRITFVSSSLLEVSCCGTNCDSPFRKHFLFTLAVYGPIPSFPAPSLSLLQIIMGKGRDSIQWNDDISPLVGQMGTLFWSATNKRECLFLTCGDTD